MIFKTGIDGQFILDVKTYDQADRDSKRKTYNAYDRMELVFSKPAKNEF